MEEKNSLVINKKNVLRQKPRLLYAGQNVKVGEQGLDFESHSHDFCEFFLVLEGSGDVTISEKTYPIKKRDLVIFNKGALHKENFSDIDSCEIMFAAFKDIKLSGLDDDCLILNEGAVIPTESYFDSFVNHFTELIKELESDQPFHENICAYLSNIVIMQILRIVSYDYELTFAKNNAYIEAKKYFDTNFTDIESLEIVCKSLYINKFYLSHLFKEQIGIPPVKYLINKRVDLAKKLLEETELNVCEISQKCGYVDVGYFCRVFKNCAGTTPLQHRFNYKSNKQK